MAPARRLVLLASCALTLSTSVLAQAPRVRTLGFLGAANDPLGWLAPLRALGWTEGRNLAIVRRPVDDPAAVPRYAQEFVDRNVDVIVTDGTAAARAAKTATARIPIVMAAVGDPVDTGLVASLAHPGGNVTGYSIVATETAAKRAQIVHDLVPAARVVGVVMDPDNGMYALLRERTERAYRTLGIEPRFLFARTTQELAAALAAPELRLQALDVVVDVGADDAAAIVGAATGRGIPVVGASRPIVEAGAAACFESDRGDQNRRVAALIDKALHGVPPSAMPVEQPAKFLLVLNLKAATAAGIALPPALLLRADEVLR